VIAVVIFLTAVGLAITAVYLYRQKETYGTPEAKAAEPEDSSEAPFSANQADSHNIPCETTKEYFI